MVYSHVDEDTPLRLSGKGPTGVISGGGGAGRIIGGKGEVPPTRLDAYFIGIDHSQEGDNLILKPYPQLEKKGLWRLCPSRFFDPTRLVDTVALTALAEESYETAFPVGMGFLQPFRTPSGEVPFREHVAANLEDDNERSALRMDYVRGRQCKTFVGKRTDDDRNTIPHEYVLYGDTFKRDRYDPVRLVENTNERLHSSPENDVRWLTRDRGWEKRVRARDPVTGETHPV